MAKNLFNAQFDAETELKDTGAALTAAAAGTVKSAAKVVNIGPAFASMVAIVDVDALDVASADEGYTITIQGSTSSTFASDVVTLATMRYGKAAVIGESADRLAGRTQRPFFNTVDGVKPYPYLRAYMTPVGTTPSITYRCFLTKNVM